MQVTGLMLTSPPNCSRWMAPVGQPIKHTGSAQCMQALATISRPLVGPFRRKRGLLSCVEAQARTQSSQRVQRSKSMTIEAVPLKKRLVVRNSRVSALTFSCDSTTGKSEARSTADSTGAGSSRAGSEGSTICSITRVGTISTCEYPMARSVYCMSTGAVGLRQLCTISCKPKAAPAPI